MNNAYLTYIITEAFCLSFSIVLMLRLKEVISPEKGIRMLKTMFLFNIVMLAADMVWAFTESGFLHLPVLLNASVNAVADISVACGCYYWYRFTDERLHFPFHENRTSNILMQIPIVIICTLDIISIFTGLLFYIDAENHYQETVLFTAIHGTVNFFYLMIPTVFSVHRMIHAHSRQKRGEYLAYALYILLPVFCTLFDDSLLIVPILALTTFAAMLLLFLVIYVDREREFLESQRELSESRAAVLQKEQELDRSRMAIMLSQIQPHFLYNTLTTIQTMCHGKAPEAEESIVQFSHFLRGNLDSLPNRIPFRSGMNWPTHRTI
jgi:hypothetical protein